MYPTVNFDNLIDSLQKYFTEPDDIVIGFVEYGKDSFHKVKLKRGTRTIALLFSNPLVPFTKNEIIPALEQIHHHSSSYLDIYCAGYFAYLPPDEFTDRIKVGDTSDMPWEYSATAMEKFKNDIERSLKWEYSGETDLLIFDVKCNGATIRFDASNALAVNLEQLMRDKSINSVRSFFSTIIKFSKEGLSTYQMSDRLGLGKGLETAEALILSALPADIAKKFHETKHFSIRNLEKKPK